MEARYEKVQRRIAIEEKKMDHVMAALRVHLERGAAKKRLKRG